MKIFSILVVLFFATQVSTFAKAEIELQDEEQNFITLINQFRNSLGLSTLAIHPSLQLAARNHSDWMAANKIFNHSEMGMSPFMRIAEAGLESYTRAGENIAYGNETALGTFKQWAHSAGHLENMINPHFYFLGIARARTNTPNKRGFYTYYWTNDFASVTDPALDDVSVLTGEQIQAAILAVENGQH